MLPQVFLVAFHHLDYLQFCEEFHHESRCPVFVRAL